MKPNGRALRKQAETCKHPKKARWADVDNGELVCRGDLGGCGEVLQRQVKRTSDIEKFGRGPTNPAVFRKNLGSTSKNNIGQGIRGPEPYHLHALAQVYGRRNGEKAGSLLLTKTCPSCGKENHLRMFGDQVRCDNCESGLADYVLRWLPNGNDAKRFWADLRLLQRWDPPEDDVAIKGAREIFSERLNGKLADEDAARIAAVYMKSVKQLLIEQRRDLKGLFEGVLDSILMVEGVNA